MAAVAPTSYSFYGESYFTVDSMKALPQPRPTVLHTVDPPQEQGFTNPLDWLKPEREKATPCKPSLSQLLALSLLKGWCMSN